MLSYLPDDCHGLTSNLGHEEEKSISNDSVNELKVSDEIDKVNEVVKDYIHQRSLNDVPIIPDESPSNHPLIPNMKV